MRDSRFDRQDYLRSLAARLNAAGHGQRGAIIESAAEFLDLSRQGLYAALREVGWTSGRKLRGDRGDSDVSRDEVLAVAAIMRASTRANGKALLPVVDAIEMALANGVLHQRVTPNTMMRLMRLHHCHPTQVAQAATHTRMRSLHPNHVWQLDASVCVLYRLRNGRACVMDERKFNARKPRDLAAIINERILRYAVSDHTSGSVYARYYQTAGEDQATLFQFLMHAMQRREDGMMHGVPLMLVWDAGSANMAHGIQNLLTGLAVRHWTHVPGNPRAKGQVEMIHNVIERKFEGRLAFMRTESLEQLNDNLDVWLKAFNGNAIHSRHRSTRWAVWQTIRSEQLRLCPPVELCRELLFAKPVERTVSGNLTIEYTCKGFPAAFYSVAHIPTVRAKDRVAVTFNPYRAPDIFVVAQDDDGAIRYHECTPLAEDRHGFAIESPVFGERYRAPADTAIDATRKEINERAYGKRDTRDADNAKAAGKLAFDGKLDAMKDVREAAAQVPSYIQRRGTDLHVSNPVQIDLKPLSHVEALFELRARLGRALTTNEAATVARLHPDGVPHEALDALIDAIRNPMPEVQERPRLVAIK
jgi:hypothetical protein